MSDSKFLADPVPNKTCVVVGTRPGIIKMSPVIRELQTRNVDSFTIHAGQHYSYELDGQIFDDLDLDRPRHRVDGIEETEFHGEQTAEMLTGIEQVLLEERPENVLVCGDANYNLAGALAARKLQVTLGHVEAGLRSGDWRMPEEHNRIMIDHISDHLFAPTREAKENAVANNVNGIVHVTGNTIVDATTRNLDVACEKSNIVADLGLTATRYAVFTAHREENVDKPDTLAQLIEVLERATAEHDFPVVYPVHPRTEKRLEQFGLDDRIEAIDSLKMMESLGYLDFLALLFNASVALTDSGGVQEEACIIGVPCVTLRENTERPETVDVGANVISGTDPDDVLNHVTTALDADVEWENPFGDGTASEQIVDVILEN